LMIVKQRTGWGYETLVREVSDSLHLRRFCLIAIDQRVPEESTSRSSFPAITSLDHAGLASAGRATEPASRAGSVTSSAATGYAEPG
jgi:hypothetical protein